MVDPFINIGHLFSTVSRRFANFMHKSCKFSSPSRPERVDDFFGVKLKVVVCLLGESSQTGPPISVNHKCYMLSTIFCCSEMNQIYRLFPFLRGCTELAPNASKTKHTSEGKPFPHIGQFSFAVCALTPILTFLIVCFPSDIHNGFDFILFPFGFFLSLRQ